MKKTLGFTYVELFVVIFLIAILASVLIPYFKSYLTPKLYNAARRLVSDIQYTQNLAETTQNSHRVTFYPALDKYCVYKGTFTVVSEPGSTKPLVRDFTVSTEFKNIDIELAEFPAGTEYLEFNPIGVPASGGRARLSYDGETYQINVEDNTGNVTLQKI